MKVKLSGKALFVQVRWLPFQAEHSRDSASFRMLQYSAAIQGQ